MTRLPIEFDWPLFADPVAASSQKSSLEKSFTLVSTLFSRVWEGLKSTFLLLLREEEEKSRVISESTCTEAFLFCALPLAELKLNTKLY